MRKARVKLAELRVNFGEQNPAGPNGVGPHQGTVSGCPAEEPGAPADLREAKAHLAELRIAYAEQNPNVQAALARIKALEESKAAGLQMPSPPPPFNFALSCQKIQPNRRTGCRQFPATSGFISHARSCSMIPPSPGPVLISVADGRRKIEIRFTDTGAKKFEAITATNIGHQLAIVFRGQVLSAPVIQSVIPGGECQVTAR